MHLSREWLRKLALRHGTHTAGIICGGTVDGQPIGIAPDAKLCSGVVIEGGKPLVRVLCGLDWMFDQGVRVVCVSLGLPGYNPVFEMVLARLRTILEEFYQIAFRKKLYSRGARGVATIARFSKTVSAKDV